MPVVLDNNRSAKRIMDPPSCDDNLEELNIFDIDQAMFDLFDKTINAHVEQNGISKKVPVIFAAGERWALVRNHEALRDKNGTIILPMIAIRRLEMLRAT